MTSIRLFATLSFVFAIAGCAIAVPPLPQARQDRGAVVMSAAIQPLLGSPHRAQVACFARLDDSVQPLGTQASNFHKDGRVHMLNLPPGRYRAVAASFRVGLLGPGDNCITYFPREVIEGTTVMVRPGALVAVGNMWANFSIFGAHASKAAPSTLHYRGSLIEVRRDAQERQALLLEAKEDLAGTGWAAAPPGPRGSGTTPPRPGSAAGARQCAGEPACNAIRAVRLRGPRGRGRVGAHR